MKTRAIVFSLEWILANALVLLSGEYSFYALPWALWNITFGIFLFKLFTAPAAAEEGVWPIGPTVGALGFVLTAIKIHSDITIDIGGGGYAFSMAWNHLLGYAIQVLGLALVGISSDALGDEWSDAPPPNSDNDKSTTTTTAAAAAGEASELVKKTNSRATTLVKTGPYRFVRHPIYTGLLMEALGATVTGGFASKVACLALASVTAAYIVQLTQEERELTRLTGGAYEREYAAATRHRLVPFLF